MIRITQAIASLYSGGLGFTLVGEVFDDDSFKKNVKFVVSEDEHGVAVFGDNEQGLTWTDVKNEHIRLQTEYDALEYARLREADYPSLQDCLHAILDDDLEALQVKRQEVKNRYPKP